MKSASTSKPKHEIVTRENTISAAFPVKPLSPALYRDAGNHVDRTIALNTRRITWRVYRYEKKRGLIR